MHWRCFVTHRAHRSRTVCIGRLFLRFASKLRKHPMALQNAANPHSSRTLAGHRPTQSSLVRPLFDLVARLHLHLHGQCCPRGMSAPESIGSRSCKCPVGVPDGARNVPHLRLTSYVAPAPDFRHESETASVTIERNNRFLSEILDR